MSRNIVLITASPRTDKETSSGTYISRVDSRLDTSKVKKATIDVRQSLKGQTEQDFKTISDADVIVIAFPLYFFCMPGILTRYLEDYYRFYLETGKIANGQKVYAIVNCGFPEPNINEEAARVIKSFCRDIGAEFRFGILIGAGGMIIGAKDAPFMKKTILSLNSAFDEIVKDSLDDNHISHENYSIKPNFPRRLYYFMGNMSFNHFAKKNGLRKKDVRRKPYRNM